MNGIFQCQKKTTTKKQDNLLVAINIIFTHPKHLNQIVMLRLTFIQAVSVPENKANDGNPRHLL